MAGLIVFLAVCVTVVLLYAVKVARTKKRAYKLLDRNLIHEYPQWPIVGHSFRLMQIKSAEETWDYVKTLFMHEKGSTLHWIGHIPILTMTDPVLIERVLSSSETTEKAYLYRLLKPITDGIFSAKVEVWKKLRKKLNTTFSAKQMESYTDMINHNTAAFLQVMKLKENDGYFDMFPYIGRYFFDTIAETHFGHNPSEQLKDKFHFIEAVAAACNILIGKRILNPAYYPEFLFGKTKLGKEVTAIKDAVMVHIHKFYQESLDLRKLEAKENDESKPKYFEMVQEVMKEYKIPTTVPNIVEITSDLLVAGSDTTAIGVCSAIYNLATHQDVQEKLFQEIYSVYGEERHINLTKKELSDMPYLDMVLKESLRLSAPPGVVREMRQDFDVGLYTIPKGTVVYIGLYRLHRDPLYWEKPDEFNPDNFLPEKVQQRTKYTFMPFIIGPRNCPGMNYAYVAMKAIIATTIRNYRVETNVNPDTVKYKMVFMQEHADGYNIKLCPREK